ncbi:hypothetical protein FN924_07495 [Radiobacillus deserti]|uniref:Uncharacterized protein n=1 Tax=Radiobacillus deserti TaxID=2594883 RepID=A0A516KF35_9BACI|nr:hypothetical protein FN924_07495 [Radiobacillus deserti]
MKDIVTGIGLTESNTFILVGLLSISVSYVLLKPIIRLFVLLQWDKLLTFLLSSGFILAIIVSVIIETDVSNFYSAIHVLLGFCIYGFFIGTLSLFRYIFSPNKNSKQSVAQKA